MGAIRLLALLVGLMLILLPPWFVLGIFGFAKSENLMQSLVVALLFYGCLVAGVWNQRRQGRVGGKVAFRGAMHAVGILTAIGYFGPFVYGALTQTDPGSLAPIFGVLIAIFGIPVAIGMGLMVYGSRR